jgi:hypothetical protein
MRILSKNLVKTTIALSVITTGIIICISFSRKTGKENDLQISKKKIERPLKNVNVEFENYSIEVNAKSTLKYKTGSTINIPSAAFIDEKGKPVTGKVDIQYREFHDPADFFISGIPMTYDSAGMEYHFESAGMLEIMAFQDKKPVFINPNKKIIVEMASKQPDDKYNIYQFDSVAGNWKYVYKDKVASVKPSPVKEMMNSTVKKTEPNAQKILNEKNEELLKPKLLSNDLYHFNLDVNLKEFPEFAIYKDLQFEVKEGEKDFSSLYASHVWTDVVLKKSNKGSYLMTLSESEESHTFEVNPVFDNESFKPAYEKYEMLLKERKSIEAKQKRKNDSIKKVLDTEISFQIKAIEDNMKKSAGQAQTQGLVQRVFVISGFGIWNSDCPASLPKGEQFAATYTDSTGKELKFATIFLVEKGRNAMFSIYSGARLSFNPSKDNLLWGVTADNKLAILEEEKFKFLKKKDDKCVIELKIIDKEITKAYEIRELLKL